MSDDSVPSSEEAEASPYALPQVDNFDDVNKNFSTLSEAVTNIIQQMKEHTEITNDNLSRLAQETALSIEKLTNDLKTILSSQAMMLTLCIFALCFLAVVVKGMWDMVWHFI